MKKRITHLDSLRGIAAIIVAIYHLSIDSFLKNSFTYNGYIMVDFFFVLSGYVIALNYQDKLLSIEQIIKFQFKRFLRVYPLHFFTLILFLIIELLKLIVEIKFNIVANNPAFDKNNISSFFQNIFLIQNLFLVEETWNEPSWSISAEFYTYFVFALVVYFLRLAFKNLLFFYLLIAVIIYILLIANIIPNFGFTKCLYCFFIGASCFNLEQFFKKKIPSFFAYVFLLLAILLIIFNQKNNIFYELSMPLIFLLLIFFLNQADRNSFLIILLNKKILAYLGSISYSIYMMHSFVWWILNQILRFGFGFETQNSTNGRVLFNIENIFQSNLVTLFSLLVLLLISHYSFKYLENLFYKKN